MTLVGHFLPGDWDHARLTVDKAFQMGIAEGERRAAAREVLTERHGPAAAEAIFRAEQRAESDTGA